MHTSSMLLSLVFACSGVATAQFQVTLEPSRDNTLYESPTGAWSNGAGTRLFSGLTNNTEIRRGLVAFDLSTIPAGSTIQAVDLQLTVVRTISAPQPVDLYRVLAEWGEAGSVAGGGQGGGTTAQPGDATWTDRILGTAAWTTVGGDFAATASATFTAPAGGPVVITSTPTLVADVQAWLDGTAGSFGWLLHGDEVNGPSAVGFATREEPVAADRPQLRVTFTPPPASATSFGSGCTGGGANVLTLAASGRPSVPAPTFALSLTGGPANGPHAFSIALARAVAPIPLGNGCFLLIDPATVLAGPAGNASRTLGLPIPNDAGLLGLALAVQGVAADLSTGRLATSNGLELRFGS